MALLWGQTRIRSQNCIAIGSMRRNSVLIAACDGNLHRLGFILLARPKTMARTMSHVFFKTNDRSLRRVWYAAMMTCLSVQAAIADDLFQKMPPLARSFGELATPLRIPIPQGVPISIGLPSPQPSSETFKSPGSTTQARPGIDPFTNRDIPMRPN